MTTTGTSSLTTTERMVDGVHRNTANFGSVTFPTISAGLAVGNILMLQVPDLTDSGHVGCQNLANLAGRQPQQGIFALFGHQLGIGPGCTGHLPTSSRIEFDIMNDRSHGNLGQRKRVARFDVCLDASQNTVTDFESHRRQNIPLFTIGVGKQGDARTPVWVILDGGNFSRHIHLGPLEIDDTVQTLVSTATPARSDTTV